MRTRKAEQTLAITPSCIPFEMVDVNVDVKCLTLIFTIH